MPSPRTIIEFRESDCQIFVWESEKGAHVLKRFLRVPLEKPEGKRDTPGAGSSAIQANGAALRQVLRATGLKIHEALVILPKEWVRLRVVTLPATEPAELADMARFEAQRYIPFNVERHVISHHVLGSAGLGATRVALAAIDGPPAEEITATMDAAGVRVSALEVSALALCNALLYSGQWNSEANPTVVQIDVGQTSTDINILNRGVPVFARSIALGVDKLFTSPAVEAATPDSAVSGEITAEQINQVDLLIPPDEEMDGTGDRARENGPSAGLTQTQVRYQWVNRLIHEIRRTYDFAHREFECEPLTQAFLSGIGADLRNLDQILQTSLGIEPVKLNPFDNRLLLDKDSLPAGLSPSVLAVGVGGLLRDTDEQSLRINLLPPLYIQKNLGLRRKRSLMVTGTLALAFLFSGFLFVSQSVGQRMRELRAYEKAIQDTEERVKEIRYRKTVVRILKANTSQQGSALALLNTLSGYSDLFNDTHMRVSLEQFDYAAQDDVKLVGWAWDYKDQNDFVTKLSESGHFREVIVETRVISTLPGKSEQLVRFTLDCLFPKGGKTPK